MCGLTAILDRAGRGLGRARSESLIAAMTASIAHRGPDGDGFWFGQHAAIGHRRLAVLDLETGDQPMASADGRIQVVFNGEIYNHHDLRAELEAKGHSFVTRSDTEVIVHGFREWGEGLCDRLIGMFAIVAHDAVDGRTLLARDPIGKKPLFYAEHDGLLLLASEARAFLVLDEFRPELDPEALREFLALRYVPGARSLLANVSELEPGSYALHRPGEALAPKRYFAPPFAATVDDGGDFEGAALELRTLIERCTADRLEADVPLGAFLSGGVDSSAIVYAMQEAHDGRVQAVTVGFDDKRFDERRYARELAERLDIELFEELCSVDPEATMPQLAEMLDLPQTDSSVVPTWLVCRVARKHVTVALSGDGGDESFAGYRRYRFDLLENRARRLVGRRPAKLLAAVAPKGDWLPRPLRFKRTLENLAQHPAEAYCRSVSSLTPEEVDAMLLPEVGAGCDPFRELREVYGRSPAADHGSKILDLDLQTYLPGDILTKVDRCSMAVSLEVRSPLLDRRVVERAARMPLDYKLDAREGKKVLKAAVEPWLGREWMQRPKQGFAVPLADWLRGPLRARRDAAIDGAFARRFFDRDVLRTWAGQHDAGRRDRSEALWAVLILHGWNERWGRQA